MHNLKLLDFKLYNLLFYFTVYSFLGWGIETLYMSVQAGHLIKRGFLFGPFCVIYGFGALILIVLLTPKCKNFVQFLFGSMLLTTALEYITGYALEKIYNKKWWDYSDLFLNINGYIALKCTIFWGILSIFLIYLPKPHIDKLINKIPQRIGTIFFYILFTFFIINGVSSIVLNFFN